MTRLFTDGAEFGDLLFWDIVTGAPSASTTKKRTGNYAYTLPESAGGLTKNLDNLSEVFVRYAFNVNGFVTPHIGTLRKGTTTIGELLINQATQRLEIYVGGSLVDTSVLSFLVNTWYLLEWHLKIDNSVGISEVKIDGVVAATFSGDTQPGADTNVDNLFYLASASFNQFYIDDLAANDTDNSDGLNDNSWCGEGRVELLIPDGDGTVNQWTNSAATSVNNYSYVDEIPPSAADYVEDAVAGQQDMYTMADFVGTNKAILRVWGEARAIDTVPEGAQMKIGVRTGGNVYTGDAITLLLSYTRVIGEVYKLNPDNSQGWTDGDLDAIELVLEVV